LSTYNYIVLTINMIIQRVGITKMSMLNNHSTIFTLKHIYAAIKEEHIMLFENPFL
jgi:hypothetical protein